MAKNKTTENDNSVNAYIDSIANENKRKDCSDIVQLFQKQTGFQAKMWGTGIVGFGAYHYKYESGREGDMPLAAFSSRANAIVLYLSLNPAEREAILKKLGKYKTGKGCIYIQKLADIDTKVLSEMVKHSVEHNQEKHSL
jgi:hypothetical protein